MKVDCQKDEVLETPVTDHYRLFSFLDKGTAKVETMLNIIGVSFIMIIMLLTACEITGRYLFNQPIPGYVENTELMMVAIAFLGIAYNQRIGAHVRMDLIIGKFKGRSYHIAEAFLLLLSLAAYFIIFLYSLKSAFNAYQVGDVTEYLYFPTWPSKLCIPIGTFVLCLRFVIQIIKNIAQAVVGIKIRELS
jgi:TRAP-type C4-dicarboxylate transport system permease small subunit